ncbi:MAG: FAD-dependent oxidoreductase, partial [Elusimicrobiota bacterium]|nr:FAD-dependent oxidoreductase [Elusimicrobiota bacterium]
GLVRTKEINGFRHDCTGHFLHFKNKAKKEFVESLIAPVKLLKIERKSYIYTRDRYVPYPFQSHIYYLPESVRRRCLVEFLNIRQKNRDLPYGSFYDWMVREYGKGIVEEFMLPYNRKMWTVHPEKLTLQWMGRYVPTPEPEEIIAGIVSEGISAEGYNALFYYPEGGIGLLGEKLAEKVSNITYNVRVQKVDTSKKEVLAGGKKYSYDKLINTAPLKEFASKILSPANKKLLNAAEKLTHSSLLYFSIAWEGGTGPGLPAGSHWIYFPQEEFKFYRVGFPSNLDAGLAPEGASSAYVEISYPPDELPSKENISIIKREVVDKLISLEVIPGLESVIHVDDNIIENSYVIYDKNWGKSRRKIIGELESREIYTGGRYGGWEYSAMEDALNWGEKLAESCLK